MRSPSSLHESVSGRVCVRALVLCAAVAAAAAGCSSNASSGDTSLVVEVSSDAVTVENRTGSSLPKGEISLIPPGIPRPYILNMSYLASGAKRSFQLTTFRMNDGTPYRRGFSQVRSVKVTAADSSGKTFEREVPFP